MDRFVEKITCVRLSRSYQYKLALCGDVKAPSVYLMKTTHFVDSFAVKTLLRPLPQANLKLVVLACLSGWFGLFASRAYCDSALSLTLGTNSVSEAKVAGATVATVTIPAAMTNKLSILIFSDPNQITVPSSVTIPAGTNTARFNIGAVNNGDLDGVRSTTISVHADGWTPASAQLQITDDDTPDHRTIGGNLVGHLATNVYWVTASLTIEVGQSLSIDPSSTLLFAAGSELAVAGTLLAAGSDESEIRFTSAAANPTNGIWSGLSVTSSGTPQSILSHVDISYAQEGVSVIPTGDKASLLITNSAIHDCVYGIHVEADTTINIGSKAVQILANSIYNNSKHGVYLTAFVYGCDSGTCNSTSIGYNDIFGNSSGGIGMRAGPSANMGCNNGIHTSLINSSVSGNKIHGNYDGIVAYAQYGSYETVGSVKPSIHNNLIINNTRDGVRLSTDQGNWAGAFAELAPVIVNNTIVGNAGAGISCTPNAITEFMIRNNLVLENNYGLTMNSIVSTTKSVIDCNDVWANGRSNWVYYPAGYGFTVTNNPNGTPSDASLNLSADPLLAGSDGYHLSAGSPAIDAGVTNSAPALDCEGNARLGLPDLGCFELACPLLSPLGLPGGNGLGLVITGGRGMNCAMQATRDFNSWFTVTNFTVTNGVMRSDLPRAPGEAHLFYRAVMSI